MSQSFTINIINNNISECDETFKISLSIPSSTCGVVSGRNNTSEVMIRDDDGKRSISNDIIIVNVANRSSVII